MAPRADTSHVIDWRPSMREGVAMNVVGLVVLGGGMAGYGALALAGSATTTFTIASWDLFVGLLGTVAAVVVLAVVHEVLHGVVMLFFGARPRFGMGLTGHGLVPYLSTSAPGHLLTRAQYVVVAMAPSVVLVLLTVALVGWGPRGGWLVIPSALHLSGCVGDWWLVGQAGRHPGGCRYEDLRDGLRVHLP